MVYTVSTKNFLGTEQSIVTRNEHGHETQVVNIMRAEADFPGDTELLAMSLASLMNGNGAVDVPVKAPVFWKQNENGFELRIQEDGVGVTRSSLILPGSKTLTQEEKSNLETALTPDTMVAWCNGMQIPDALVPKKQLGLDN